MPSKRTGRPGAAGPPPHRGQQLSQLRRRARIALQGGDLEGGVRILEKVIKAVPTDVTARAAIGAALLELGRPRSCAQHAKELARHNPRSAEALMTAGDLLARSRSLAAAAEQYAKAAELAADPTKAWSHHATVAERLHRLDEAERLAARALERTPDNADALYVQGLVLARRKRFGEAEAVFRRTARAAADATSVRTLAEYEVARMLDRQGRYDEAMDALDRVKGAQRAEIDGLVRRSAILNRQRDDLIRSIEGRHFAPVDPAARTGALALLAGFPRSGTTLIENALDAHPGIICAEETHSLTRGIIRPLLDQFGWKIHPLRVLEQITPRDAAARRGHYLRLIEEYLGESIGGRLLIDKNPTHAVLVPYLKRLFPGLKVIAALRDPRDVLISCYLMPWAGGREFNANLLSLRETAEQYALYMRAWLRYRRFIPGDFVEVRYEDTVEDLEGQVRRILAALELPWDDAVLSYRDRAARRPAYSPTYADVTRPIYREAMQRWRNYEKHLEPVLPILDPFIKEFGYA